MYKSVAEIVGTNIEIVKRFVRKNADEIVDRHYDEYGIERMDLSQLLKGNEIKQIDSLRVSHITPQRKCKKIWDQGLLTLAQALTQKTELSDYLKNIGFTFLFEKGQIVMYKEKVKQKIESNTKHTFVCC